MLGRFHEISLETPDIRASVEFYERLGFSQAPTGDTWPHPYGVLTDGRIFLGLHQRGAPSPALTFVREGIARHAASLEARAIDLELRRTGDEVFNEIAFRDPSGQRIAVLEARTYSPVTRLPSQPSGCGYFSEFSLPAADFAAAKSFWEPLGFVAMEESAAPYPRLLLTSDHLNLAFHGPRTFNAPMLVFSNANMRARIAALRALNLELTSPLPRGCEPQTSALLMAPEGTALLLTEDHDGPGLVAAQ
jgi:catechol 2,3-dioxygenase-like lactoylglutathione lyase family enzyme